MNTRTLLRAWLACAIGCLPLLGLLLVPQLMRSRAGDERMLLLGVVLLLLLLIAAFVCAPVFTAWSARVPGRTEPIRALRSTREVWRHSTRHAAIALALGIAVYALGQVAGYLVGVVVPPVSDNPAHPADPSASPWVIHYPAYALQAFVIYSVTTLAAACYAWRMRALDLRRVGGTDS